MNKGFWRQIYQSRSNTGAPVTCAAKLYWKSWPCSSAAPQPDRARLHVAGSEGGDIVLDADNIPFGTGRRRLHQAANPANLLASTAIITLSTDSTE